MTKPRGATTPTLDTNAIYTSAVRTAEAPLTQTALAEPTATTTPLQTAPPHHSPTPPIATILDVPSLLGRTIPETEKVLGTSLLITGPIDEFEGRLAGGQYRDYAVDRYTATIAYDSGGIARVFFVLSGMSDANYALSEWNRILPMFGVHVTAPPDTEAPMRVAWSNYQGLYVTVAGDPIWTIQIAQHEFRP